MNYLLRLGPVVLKWWVQTIWSTSPCQPTPLIWAGPRCWGEHILTPHWSENTDSPSLTLVHLREHMIRGDMKHCLASLIRVSLSHFVFCETYERKTTLTIYFNEKHQDCETGDSGTSFETFCKTMRHLFYRRDIVIFDLDWQVLLNNQLFYYQ